MILTVTNQKGGTGKTTTAQLTACGLMEQGKKTLLVDLDPQSNLTYCTGADSNGKTSFDILQGETTQHTIQNTQCGDIIPASSLLANANNIFTETGKEYRLREALQPVKGNYDFVIIDTPPALGILTVNALVAGDAVIIPANADIFSLQGIGQLLETITPVKRYCNAELKITGILLTRFNPRIIISKEIKALAEQAAEQLQTRLFETTIREGTTIKEAQASRVNPFIYSKSAKVVQDYRQYVKELLERTETT